jgi:hypothetical protein
MWPRGSKRSLFLTKRKERKTHMNLTTEVLIAVAIVASILLQFGSHAVDWRRIAMPLVIVGGFAVFYVKEIPTSGNDALFTLAGVVLGVVLGAAAGALMAVRRDATGRVILTAGVAYAALWIIVFAARLGFAVTAQNSPSTLRDLFVWAYRHGITEQGWTDFFLLQALAMVGVRTLITGARVLLAAHGSGSTQPGAVALR